MRRYVCRYLMSYNVPLSKDDLAIILSPNTIILMSIILDNNTSYLRGLKSSGFSQYCRSLCKCIVGIVTKVPFGMVIFPFT